MNELMALEIADQPGALRVSLPQLRTQATQLTLLPGGALHFTGSGDSYIAPLALRFAYQRYLSRPVEAWPAMEAAHYAPLLAGDTLVAISISGEARRTIEAAQSALNLGAQMVAIGGNAQSTLTRLATAALILPVASRSRATPHTIDYSLTLLALAVLLERLHGQPLTLLDALPDLVQQTLDMGEGPIATLAPHLAHAPKFCFLGAGPSYATALYAAAKFWEAAGIAAYTFQLEEFAHGPHLMLDPQDVVVVIAPAGPSLPRAFEICGGLDTLGLATVIVTDQPATFGTRTTLVTAQIDEPWSPFLTCLPLQQLCLQVANARGYDVVTKTGRLPDPQRWETAHKLWVRESKVRPRGNR